MYLVGRNLILSLKPRNDELLKPRNDELLKLLNVESPQKEYTHNIIVGSINNIYSSREKKLSISF